jgi:alkylhydroperoxidase/carboxymuconolactone decarboxylase family protein YurZ
MAMNHEEQKHPCSGLDLKTREMLTVAVLTVLGYSQAELKEHIITFIKIAPDNPVLWKGMKGASVKGR